MQLLTFNEILTELCDDFDSLISPNKIARSNTNIIYLMFKAIAKGFELVNNICVTLSHKFDPANCDDSDLDSVSKIVGTIKRSASASGLNINVTNNSGSKVTLSAGTYYYEFDADTTFEFEVVEDVEIGAGSYISFVAMSTKTGTYQVTAQSKISVTSSKSIDSNLQFSCTDNAALTGLPEETNIEFRERILKDTGRQNSFVELENTIKNLPYIFDCKLKFNDSTDTVFYDGYVLPPFTAVIFFSGEIKNELAEKVAEKIICPTLKSSDSVTVFYENDVFITGRYEVNLTPFKTLEYGVEIAYRVNDVYANDYDSQVKIRTTLFDTFSLEMHKDYIKEEDIYNVVSSLEIAGIDVLGVDIIYNGVKTDYIDVPVSRIPRLTNIKFTRV